MKPKIVILIISCIVIFVSAVNLWRDVLIGVVGKEITGRVVRLDARGNVSNVKFTYRIGEKNILDSVNSQKPHFVGEQLIIKYWPKNPQIRSVRWIDNQKE
jgi:hypothetical protein